MTSSDRKLWLGLAAGAALGGVAGEGAVGDEDVASYVEDSAAHAGPAAADRP